MRKLDLTGQRFGRLIVLEEAEPKSGHRRWLCKCDCGGTTISHQTSLRSGKAKSCGCLVKETAGKYEGPRRRTRKDIKGQRFGHLTVLGEAPSRNKWEARWICRCDCGKEVDVSYGALASGGTTSCGCAIRKKHSERMKLFNEERKKSGAIHHMFKDLTGRRFGLLTVLGQGERSNGGAIRWRCLCDCGKETIVLTGHLNNGHTTSCGCVNRKAVLKSATKHGGARTKLYILFHGMHDRCEREKNSHYKWYGGRGIKVCDEWSDFVKFKEWALSHGYQEGLTIDRINPDGNYCPENCEWVTRSENLRRRHETHSKK